MCLFDEGRLREALPVSILGKPLYYHRSVNSTNDEAISLAHQGAPHGTLVIAEAQSKGRGRGDKLWVTVPGKSIAFSLVLRPEYSVWKELLRLNAIGTLGVIEALGEYGLVAHMKWPNDVLLAGKKVAGILLEAFWLGERLDFVILGVGINLFPASIPEKVLLDFPAISVFDFLKEPFDPHLFLRAILQGMSRWYSRMETQDFWSDCQRHLAYLGERVVVVFGEQCIMGRLFGIDGEGNLRLLLSSDEEISVGFEALSLRPVREDNER